MKTLCESRQRTISRETILLAILVLILSSFILGTVNAQNFKVTNISDRILTIEDTLDGGRQLVIKSEKGLVVFDTYWSEITSRKYKEGIAKALNRDDFAYVINIVDRLDMFGGNAAYKGATIIGHEAFRDKYEGREEEVAAEVRDLIDMWRWKEGVSRERLDTLEKGSEVALNEERWMNSCHQRVEELENGFSLVLPTVYYDDRMELDLGDITLELIWFGKAGNYNGMTVINIPEEKTAVISNFILHSAHFAPYPYGNFAELDVPRWIAVLEELLEGENAVDKVICDHNQVWTRERALPYLGYIRKLWNRVTELEAAGKELAEVHNQLSLDNEFAFVKETRIYADNGDDWLRPQHYDHTRVFYFQHKNLASEMLKKAEPESFAKALSEIRELREKGGDIYFDESSINNLGYNFIYAGDFEKAIEVLKLNVETHPESANVYDSLGEAFMKNGDKENAVANYKKSLALNPDNENAKQMLAELENM